MLDRSRWILPKEETPALTGLLARARLAMTAALENNTEALRAIMIEVCADYLRKRSSILSAAVRSGPDDAPVVAAMIAYKPTKHPPVTEPRVFDALFFLAMMVLDWGGGRFRFHPTTRSSKLYLNLRYEHPAYHHGGFRIYLARIIGDTPPTKQTPFADDHHSYRCADLRQQRPDSGLPKPEHGRARAVELARELYEARLLPGVDTVLVEEFTTVLVELFDCATAFHAQEVK